MEWRRVSMCLYEIENELMDDYAAKYSWLEELGRCLDMG